MYCSVSDIESLKCKLSRKKYGVYNIDDSIYHHPDCPGISRSQLCQFAKSGLHYQLSKFRPKEPTEPMKFGSLAHLFFLFDKEMIDKKVGIFPPFKGVRGNTIADQKEAHIKAHGPSKLWVTLDQYSEASKMLKATESNPLIKALKDCRLKELSVFDTDKETDILLKAKPDAFQVVDNKLQIYDLKTTKAGGGKAKEFQKTVCNQDSKLYLQATMTIYLLKMVTGLELDFFRFIVVEKEPPYAVSCFELEDAFIDYGYDELSYLLNKFKRSLDKNLWEGYPTETQIIQLPKWMEFI